MKAYTVQSNLSHNNKDYTPGHRIDLDDEFSAALVAAGVIVEGYDGTETSTANENTQAPANTGPADAAERLAAIKEAIATLNLDNGELWLKDGKPTVDAIFAVTGWKLSAGERDLAWSEVKPA